MRGEIEIALEAGETLMVSRNGIVVGEIRGLGRPASVPREIVVAAFARGPAIDRHRFRADVNAVLDQDPTPHT